MTDADLVLAAYDRWGPACAENLVGAFAFALWDAKKGLLYCARDHAGIRPFFYTENEEAFAFASEMQPLLKEGFASDSLDDVAVGDYLLSLPNDPVRTFYSDVRALPPAHYGILENGEFRLTKYWSLDDAPPLDVESPTAYLEEFRERFTKAVRARLRTPDGVDVGSLLSGGLDSSSIAVTAANLRDEPLPTFSATAPDVPEADEREYIDAVVTKPGFDPHFVRADEVSPLEHFDERLTQMSQPIGASTLYQRWELYRKAAEQEVDVLLDGFGGDQVLSWGFARFPELLRTGQLLELAREVRQFATRHDKSVPWILYRRVYQPMEPSAISHLRGRLNGTADPVSSRSAVIDEEFADRIGLRSRVAEFDTGRRWSTRADQRRILGNGRQADGCEIANISAAHFGIEPRFPFLDRRLMELCYRMPPELRLKDGWRRWTLRNALADTLPEKIRTRTSKGAPGAALYDQLRSEDADEITELFEADQFPPQLDRDRVQAEWEAFLDREQSNPGANVWRPALLCRWYQLTDCYD